MKILIIDGQGGKIGASIIAELKEAISDEHEIIAIGTNSAATASMLRAGADVGATGENPVKVNSAKADLIIGTVGIITADSLFGEITADMAAAVGRSGAHKILIPFNRCNIFIAGTADQTIGELISKAVKRAVEYIKS